MPFINLDIMPDGSLSPCCQMPLGETSGSINAKSIEEFIQTPMYQTLLSDLLKDKKNDLCKKCHDVESCGGVSERQFVNNSNKELAQKVFSEGKKTYKLERLGLRFSNLCNFKCRYCNPLFSSKWLEDKDLIEPSKFNSHITAFDNFSSLEKLIIDNKESLKAIYFAGGEPLLEKDHLKLLDLLISMGMNHVALYYNTNLSVLELGKVSILELWKNFKNVIIDASIDAWGEVNDQIRTGSKFKTILDNRKRLAAECPKIYFNVYTTLSNMNILYLADFIERWLELGLDHPGNFSFNYVHDPVEFSIQNLENSKKVKAKQSLLSLIKSEKLKLFEDDHVFGFIIKIKAIIKHMETVEADPKILELFYEKMKKFDERRNENLSELLEK